MSSSDSGVENSNMRPFWIEAVEAFLAQFEQVIAQGSVVAPACDRETARTSASLRAAASICVRDLIHRVALDLIAAVGAEGAAGARAQQAQEIVELGGGGDGGARIARGVLLPDGDGRRDAVDLVDVGLLHALEELARVGRERFDVAALAFGVDGVEDERRLAGAGHAGDHRQLLCGMASETFFRLWTRAPRMRMESSKE